LSSQERHFFNQTSIVKFSNISIFSISQEKLTTSLSIENTMECRRRINKKHVRLERENILRYYTFFYLKVENNDDFHFNIKNLQNNKFILSIKKKTLYKF